jgi:hypothetical protein
MRLYLIKRKSDGLFFGNINGAYIVNQGASRDSAEYWSAKPQCLLKTPDGVAANLRRLCSEPYWDTTPPPKVCSAVAAGWKELAWRNFDPSNLDLYEVVVLDVDLISVTATPAQDFVQTAAIASAPLTSRERKVGVDMEAAE